MPSTVRARGDLPAIGRSVETRLVNDKLVSQPAQKAEPMLIDDIQFWDGGTEPPSGLGSRKPSATALELAQIAADAEDGIAGTSNDQRVTGRASHVRSKMSVSKQEMC